MHIECFYRSIVLKGGLCLQCAASLENPHIPQDCLTTEHYIAYILINCMKHSWRDELHLVCAFIVASSAAVRWPQPAHTSEFWDCFSTGELFICERVNSTFYCHHRTMCGRECQRALTALTITGKEQKRFCAVCAVVIKTWLLGWLLASHTFSPK